MLFLTVKSRVRHLVLRKYSIMEPDLYPPSSHLLASLTTRPLLLNLRSSKTFILAVVTIAVFTDTFFYTLIIPILPDMLQERAGIPPQKIQRWISIMLSIYSFTNLLTSPVAGVVTDRIKTRKAPLLLGLVALAASTAMYAFGRRVEILVMARALQGASAAVVRVTGLALITDTYGGNQSGAALGWQSVGMFVGTVGGPSISGILYDNFGHFAVFEAAFAVLGLDILLRLLMIERKDAEDWIRNYENDNQNATETTFPRTRSQERLLEEGALQPSYSGRSDNDPSDSELEASQQTRSKFGVLSLILNRRLLTALWATFVCAIVMTALESVVPLYTTRLFSWTPTQTGLLLIALAVSILIDPLIGSWTDKHGSRWFSVFGLVLITVTYGVLTTITRDISAVKITLCIAMVFLGFGAGFVMTPNMVEISLLVHAEEKNNPGVFRTEEVMGQAYAMLSVAYGLGSLVGPVWGGTVMISFGWVALSVSFAALAGVSTLVMFLFAGGREDV